MLRGESDLGMTIGPTDDIALTKSKPSIVDAKADNIEETEYPHLSAATFAHLRGFHALHDLPYRVKRPGLQEWMQREPVAIQDILPEGGRFIEAVYTNSAGGRAYKLYIPSRYQGQALPLIVMLHGGTQTPDDFAAGTRMNLIREEQTCSRRFPPSPAMRTRRSVGTGFAPATNDGIEVSPPSSRASPAKSCMTIRLMRSVSMLVDCQPERLRQL